MRRAIWAIGVILAGAAQSAFAQSQGSRQLPAYQPPPVSPYINLLRTDQNRIVTYQGIIRPQIYDNRYRQFQQNQIDRLNSNLASQKAVSNARYRANQAQLSALQSNLNPGQVQTGHPTTFMNRGDYFPGYRRR